jgi:mono/diheme cytochrome c family protein
MNHLTLAIGVALVLPLGAQQAAAQAQAPDAQALYREHCRSCHGGTGVPTQRMATLYQTLHALDSTYLAGRSEDSIVAVLQRGVGRDMKSFMEKLTPDEMRAVAAYVRVLGGAVAKPATP